MKSVTRKSRYVKPERSSLAHSAPIPGVASTARSTSGVGEGLCGQLRAFSGSGIYLASSGNVLMCNYLGTNAAGTAKLGNGYGVAVTGSGNTISGTTAATRTVTSGAATVGCSSAAVTVSLTIGSAR